MTYRFQRLALATLSVAIITLTACADDEHDASTTAMSASPSAPDSDRRTEVVAVDFRFEGLPDRVPAGTTLTMRNDSAREIHELVVFQIPPEVTHTAEQLVALPEDDLFKLIPSEPDLVLLAPPGDESIAVFGDGTLTEPGRYMVVCAIPTGADPDEFMRQATETQDGPPDVPGGPPHFIAGMVADLTVTP